MAPAAPHAGMLSTFLHYAFKKSFLLPLVTVLFYIAYLPWCDTELCHHVICQAWLNPITGPRGKETRGPPVRQSLHFLQKKKSLTSFKNNEKNENL